MREECKNSFFYFKRTSNYLLSIIRSEGRSKYKVEIMLSKKSKILLIILAVVLLFSLNKFGGQAIKNTFYLISSPFEKILWQGGESISNFFSSLFSVNRLKRENGTLLNKNFALLKELANLKALKEENQALRDILNLGLEKQFKLSLTAAISQMSEGGFLLISGGRDDGISQHMPVITQEGVLVGKIEESFKNFSQVRLISAPSSIFDIEIYPAESFAENKINPPILSKKLNERDIQQIQEKENVFGVAQGKGYSKIDFLLVPKEHQIKKGDVVLTTTLGGNFPKGLLVGEIGEIRGGNTEPYQEGEIKPYFIETNLRRLFIIKNFEGYGQSN